MPKLEKKYEFTKISRCLTVQTLEKKISTESHINDEISHKSEMSTCLRINLSDSNVC